MSKKIHSKFKLIANAAFAVAIGLFFIQPLYAEEPAVTCQRLYHRSEYASALKPCRQAAEKGDARSQTYLGEFFDQGLGIEKNPALAAYWWETASRQDNIEAQNLLAMKYYYGGDVFAPQPGWKQDYDKAFELWHESALQGVATSQFMLGEMYLRGQGVPQDYSESYAWFHLALEGGYRLATDALVELSRIIITPEQKQLARDRLKRLKDTLNLKTLDVQ